MINFGLEDEDCRLRLSCEASRLDVVENDLNDDNNDTSSNDANGTIDLNDTNDVNDLNDANETNDLNDTNAANDTNNANDKKSAVVDGRGFGVTIGQALKDIFRYLLRQGMTKTNCIEFPKKFDRVGIRRSPNNCLVQIDK